MKLERLRQEVENRTFRLKALWIVTAMAAATILFFLLTRQMLIIWMFLIAATGVFLIYEVYGRTSLILLEISWKVKQLEAMMNIFHVLPLESPLPSMTGYAVSPDFAALVLKKLQGGEIELVVETGAGASSVVIGHYLKKKGHGRLISLEHDPFYAERARKNVADHNLEEYVEIRHAPLVSVSIGEEAYKWYDAAVWQDISSIDLLVVDGPPVGTNQSARFPAVPLLLNHFSQNVCVLLDDAKRADEEEIAKKWESDWNMTASQHDTEKGAVELSFRHGEGKG